MGEQRLRDPLNLNDSLNMQSLQRCNYTSIYKYLDKRHNFFSSNDLIEKMCELIPSLCYGSKFPTPFCHICKSSADDELLWRHENHLIRLLIAMNVQNQPSCAGKHLK